MASSLLDALESVARLVTTEDSKLAIEDGRFYLRFLGVEAEGQEAWQHIKDRIETVFPPNLLNWNLVRGEHREQRKRQKIQRQHIFSSDDESGNEDEDSKFYPKVALLTLYIAAVHDHQENLWGTLTTNLSSAQQIRLQKSFEFMLENRRNMNKETLDGLFASNSPASSSVFSTPYRTTPSVSSLGESFIYSPSNTSSPPSTNSVTSPLQDFFKAQQTKQVLETLQKELRETKSALDNEKGETQYLKSELESTSSEIEKLKQELEVTRGKLFTTANKQQSTISQSDFEELHSKYVNLQQKLADSKDTSKYLKNLETQLETTLCENKDLIEKYAMAQIKLNEKVGKFKSLEDKLATSEMKSMNLNNDNNQLKETIVELQRQISEVQAISNHRQSMMFELGGENLNDISMDNPGRILSPPPGEAMGDMVVLNLQEEITSLKAQIASSQESVEKLSSENEGLHAQVKETIAQQEKTSEENSVLMSQCKQLSENLNQARDEKDKKFKEWQETYQNLTVKLEESKALVHAEVSAKTELAGLLEELKNKNLGLEAQIAFKQDDIEKLSIENEGLNDQVKQEASKLEKVSMEKSMIESQCQKVCEDLNLARTEHDQKLKEWKETREILNGQLTQTRAHLHSEVSAKMELSTHVEYLNTQNVDLKNQITSMQEGNEKLSAKNDSLQSQLQETALKVEEITEQKSALESRYEEVSKDLKQLKTEHDDKLMEWQESQQKLTEELTETRASVDAELSAKAELTGLIEELKGKTVDLEAQVSATQEINEKLSTENESLNVQVNVATSEIKKLSEEKAILKLQAQEASNLSSAEKENLQQTVFDLQKLIENSKEQKQRTMDANQEQISKLTNDLKNAKSESNAESAKIVELEEKMAESKAREDTLEKDLFAERAQLALVKHDLASRTSEIETMKQKVIFLEASNEDMKTKAGTLEKEKEDLFLEKTQLTNSQSSLDKENESLRDQVNEATSKIAKLSEEKAMLESKSQEASKISMEEKESLQQSVIDHQKLIESSKEEKQRMLEDYQEQISKLLNDLENAKSESESESAKIVELEEKMTESKAREDTLEKDLFAERAQLALVKHDLSSRTSEIETMKQKVIFLEASNEDMKLKAGTLEKENEDLLLEKTQLTNSQSSLDKDLQLAAEQCNSLQGTLEEMEDKLCNTEKEKENIINDMQKQQSVAKDQFEQENNNLKAQIAELENEISSLKESIEKSIKVSENDLHNMGIKLADGKTEVLNLRSQLAETRALVDAETNAKTELVGLLEELKAKNLGLEEEIANGSNEKDKFWKQTMEEKLSAQRQRYDNRIKEIREEIDGKYKKKINECIEKWKSDIEGKDRQIEEQRSSADKFEGRYKIAKSKMEEMSLALDNLTEESKKKASEVKHLRNEKLSLEAKLAEISSKPSKLQHENLALKQEMKKMRMETRSLQVQFDAADAKIRELQKSNSKSTSSLPKPKDNDGFKMPSTLKNHTPGRTRATRTQSEVTMARRPPQGSGAIFAMDEEAGEMFSSSYLSDMKAGRCSIDSGRISELARRNTMQPAHLKSSYPAETQFHQLNEFTDDDLRLGKITEATANLSVDSPAMNTRRQSSIRMSITSRKSNRSPPSFMKSPPKEKPKPIMFEISPHVSRPSRKRPSLSGNDIENADVTKKARKELSYSKPGIPTPAKRHNRSGNSSLNTSNKSSNQSILTTRSDVLVTPAKAHDKTPLLDSTNKSNRSLRSIKTPLSLKKVMTKAFRRSKTKYDVKNVKKNLDTPLKRI